MSSKLKSAVALASTAAALFAMSAPLTTAHAAGDMSVKCAGLNSCKGTGRAGGAGRLRRGAVGGAAGAALA